MSIKRTQIILISLLNMHEAEKRKARETYAMTKTLESQKHGATLFFSCLQFTCDTSGPVLLHMIQQNFQSQGSGINLSSSFFFLILILTLILSHYKF